MKVYRRYLYKLSGMIVVLISLLIACMIVVDPYAIWRVYHKQGVNMFSAHAVNFERVSKPIEVMRMQPNTVFVGSSRVKFALRPEYYNALTGKSNTYNLGVNGANIYEIRRMVEHAVLNSPDLDTIILGVDFFMFNDKWGNQLGFDDGQLSKKYFSKRNFLATTFSLAAFESMIDTLVDNEKKQYTYDSRDENGRGTDGQAAYYFGWGNLVDLRGFCDSAKMFVNEPGLYREHDLPLWYMDNLRQIVRICNEHHIKLIMYISPLHAMQAEAISVAGKWSVYEQWKRELVDIGEFYDFSAFNEITAEPFSVDRKYYWDSSHYTTSVGDIILERILGQRSADGIFGEIINKNNIEQHLLDVRQEQANWRLNHADLVEYARFFRGFTEKVPEILLNKEVLQNKIRVVTEFQRNDGTIKFDKNNKLSCAGWAINNENLLIEHIIVALRRADGKSYFQFAMKQSSPEIADLFANEDDKESGFKISDFIYDVESGVYDMEIIEIDSVGRVYTSGLLNVQIIIE